ncbi:MAG TPA: EFR1 family ferrodoxin [Elusimicrobiales bacterium]|nr:EFR1 family ferrodoxin [Elusimicrobiales bacterium]
MRTTIYYYTGTGNSLWAARKLGEELKGARIAGMRRAAPEAADAEAIGLVFPVHIWGLPRRVIDFVSRLPAGRNAYYFAVAVNAGQVAGTLGQLKRLMKARGLKLSAGFSLVMPSNYIPWGGAAPAPEQAQRFAAAAKKIKDISGLLGRGEAGPVEKGPLWQNLLLSGLCYRLSYSKVPKLDKDFWTDEKCNSCSICTAVCPSGNILMEGGKPAWQGRCEQCLACLQWCPLEAIQYGKKTPGYARYHHPEIRLTDMLA